ncbi:kininogen-1 [Tenrec ecaudatus]|uniref:kininogen-1 n=1 Tax=Tenrec ecaudatus TaxID=94439 RepID=UPI003F5ACBD2
MKVITVLFLCSRLLSSLSQEFFSKEIDCNSEGVFDAVDAALGLYNENTSGNQFVLHRITQVTKMDGSDTFYSIKYQVKEGDCPVHSGKTWQDCDYKESPDAATGECQAMVKKESKNFIVVTQSCQITPAEGATETTEYSCLGCAHPLSADSPDLEPVLKHAIQHFNNNTQHPYLFALHKVKGAERQVVAGWNFEITYSIVQTNCSKEKFLFLTPECKSLLNGATAECRDLAYMDPQLRISSFTQNCDLYPGKEVVPPPTRVCAGCPMEVATNSLELQEALNHSITKLNAQHNKTNYFKIESVKKATVQVVAGKKYSVVFVARETKCSKDGNDELMHTCESKAAGDILECNASVYVIPWESKVYPTVNCRTLVKDSLRKRPPGFSPFRTLSATEAATGEVTTVSPPHTSMAPVQDEEQDPGREQGPTHRHDWGHEKQTERGIAPGRKHEHDQGHGHQRRHGFGHGHQRELDSDLDHPRKHGLGHAKGRGPAHGRKHGHGKNKNKVKNNGKHNGWRTEPLASFSEDSTTSSAQTPEKREGPTPIPSLAPPSVAVTFSGFQDADLLAAVSPNTPAPPTEDEDEDDWIPDIQTEPNSLPFNLVSDFPETMSPNCPGRPWKPVHRMNSTVEVKESHDFDLWDALK